MSETKPDPMSVFHEKHPEDQEVVTIITRNIRRLIRSGASKRAWATRKRMMAARQAAEGDKG